MEQEIIIHATGLVYGCAAGIIIGMPVPLVGTAASCLGGGVIGTAGAYAVIPEKSTPQP